MKVICDNCGAMYKIPDERLTKPVNKATCRQCGHRMLIPRPRRGADPDERTLVTAVPPTPPPAPSRGDSGPPTTPIHEVEEKTAPTGGRRTEETRWVRNDHPAPDSSGRPQVQLGSTATERVPAHSSGHRAVSEPMRTGFDEDDEVATQVGPDPTLTYTPREDDEVRVEKGPPPPARAAADEEPPATPPPAPKKKKAKGSARPPANVHDPRGDMGLALFGVMVALAGIVLLGAVSVVDATWSYTVVLLGSVTGLTLAIGGGTGAFLVLVTSGRGRKPAWRVASVILAVLLGLLVGGVPAGIRVTYDAVSTGMDSLEGRLGELMAGIEADPNPLEVEPDPALDPAMAADTDDGMADEEVADTDMAQADTDTAGEADGATDAGGPDTSSEAASTSGRSTTRRAPTRSFSGSSGSNSGTSSGRDRTPDLTDEEELDLPDDLGLDAPSSSAPAIDSSLPASPPLTAIDVMVKSNTGVKRCFFDYKQAEGDLPKRVDVKFTIKPNGDATSINVEQRKLSGSELESCLIRSIRSITFPPSQKGTTLTFPFVFG